MKSLKHKKGKRWKGSTMKAQLLFMKVNGACCSPIISAEAEPVEIQTKKKTTPTIYDLKTRLIYRD